MVWAARLGRGGAEQGRHEGDAVDFSRRTRAGEFGKGWEHVGKIRDEIGGAAGGDPAGPAGDEGHADAAFVEGELEAPQRAGALKKFGVLAAGGDRAVVAGEDDERVFGKFEFVEQVEQAADVAVETGDHRGADGAGFALGGVGFSAGKRFGLGPAVAIFSERIGGDCDLGVRRREGAEEEKRAVFISADEVERLAHEEILGIHGAAAGGVLGDLDALAVFPKVIGVVGVGVGLVDVAKEFVDALGGGCARAAEFAEAPFPDGPGGVTGGLEGGGERAVGGAQGKFAVGANGGVAAMQAGEKDGA